MLSLITNGKEKTTCNQFCHNPKLINTVLTLLNDEHSSEFEITLSDDKNRLCRVLYCSRKIETVE